VESGVSLGQNAMKATVSFILITAATLALFCSAISLGLKVVYWNLLKIPIGLQGGLFFLRVIPDALILSILYAGLMTWILSRQGTTGADRFRISLVVGAVASTVILAIVFPCDAQPYFVGGYLFRLVFTL
jgi:hypothetical protein